MEKTCLFSSVEEVRLRKLLRFILPTYLTSLFNTLYTMIDGIFVSACVGTNALAAINIVYPIVNILTGIALIFGAGGSAVAALRIGAGNAEEANRAFSVSVLASLLLSGLTAAVLTVNLTRILGFLGATQNTLRDCRVYALWWLAGTPLIIGKELLTCFIRVDGAPTYSFLTALAGGLCNIFLDYVLVVRFSMGIDGAAAATMAGLLLSTGMGVGYFLFRGKRLRFTLRGKMARLGLRCMGNGVSEFVDQLAVAVTTVVFNRTAMTLAGEDGIAAVSIIMYLQFLVIGVYFGFSMGMSPPLGYARGRGDEAVCRRLEGYANRFFAIAPWVLYALTFLLAPVGVGFFAQPGSAVFSLGVSGMRLYGLGFLFCGLNIFNAVRFMAYGQGLLSGVITFLRSLALLLLFLGVLPGLWGLNGVWLSVPFAEAGTLLVTLGMCVAEKKKRKLPARL